MSQEPFGLGYEKYKKYYRVLEYFIDWYIENNNYQDQDEAYNWIKSLKFQKKPTQEALIRYYLQQCKKLTTEKAKEIFNIYNAKKQTYIKRIDKQRVAKAKPPWYDKDGRTDTRKFERFSKQAKQNNQILNFEIPISSEFACGFDILENWQFYTEEEHKLRIPNFFEPYVESDREDENKIKKLEECIQKLEREKKVLEQNKTALELKYQEVEKKRYELSRTNENLKGDLTRAEESVSILNQQLALLQREKQALEIEFKKSREVNSAYQESTIQSRELLAKLKQQEQLIGQMREVLKLLAGNVIESLVEGGTDPDEFIKMTQDIKQGQIERSKPEKQEIIKTGDNSIVKQDEVSDPGAVFPTFRKFLNIVTQLLKTNL